VDNLTAGKPRLSAADVPATVFLATGYLDNPEEFWWDELSRLVLAGEGSRSFELVAGTKAVHVDLGANATAHADGSMPMTTLRPRQAALTEIWEALRRLDRDECRSVMAKIRSVLTDRGNVERGRAMTRSEVQTLVADGLVTIGAHTVTHPLLTSLGAEALQNEITRSKSDCEALLGAEITGFAYPYGDFDDGARKSVSAAGFGFACTTRHAAVGTESDLLLLPRVQVRNWDGDAFQRVIHDASADAASHARAASARGHEIA
jgi:peptidoglycan/xylan/chitin deacetylase (PgdA/CDA1 family)